MNSSKNRSKKTNKKKTQPAGTTYRWDDKGTHIRLTSITYHWCGKQSNYIITAIACLRSSYIQLLFPASTGSLAHVLNIQLDFVRHINAVIRKYNISKMRPNQEAKLKQV